MHSFISQTLTVYKHIEKYVFTMLFTKLFGFYGISHILPSFLMSYLVVLVLIVFFTEWGGQFHFNQDRFK